jgi:hypothetical protein
LGCSQKTKVLPNQISFGALQAGIYFEDQEMKRVVALDEQSNAYYVSLEKGEISEKQLPKEVLK